MTTRLILIVAVLWVSWLGCTSSSELAPGQQSKVSTALDTAQFTLKQINEEALLETKAMKDALEISKTMKSKELLKKQSILVKFGSKIGRALKAVQAASAIASFVFTFFMPSKLEVITALINERFKEVNAKLDRLDEKLDEMETSIKANSAFNTFLSAWIKWEYASKNGAKKLSEIRKAMGTKTRRIDQVKLAEEYVNYYENNNLDGNLLNLYRMAALPEGLTQRNIFDRFIAEYGCDIGKLSELMILIKNIMTSAAQQKLTYYLFKGDEIRATEGFRDVQTYFFKIRRAFDDRVWHCRSNSLDHAQNDAKKKVKEMKGSSKESIVKAIFNELKVKYPWYTWAIAAISGDRTQFRDLEWRGSTYFKVEQYYVVYEDTKSSTNCIEIKQAKTLLVFKRCGGCNSDYMYASDNILSNKKCVSGTLERMVDIPHESARISYHFQKKNIRYDCSDCSDKNLSNCPYQECIDKVKEKVQEWAFIASAVNTNYDVCRFVPKCSGHGQCKSIPFTKTHQCICERDYEGESCEKRVVFDDTIEKMMSQLRRTFNVVNGVPTAVDVFFSIRSLSQKLDVVLQKIKASFAHTNNIIKHSQVIYNVEDIADLYAKLLKNELNFEQFGQKIDRYLQTVSAFQLQNRLKKMILGQGTLDKPGKDIYNTYKREYLKDNGGGCTARYNEDIKSFRDNLAHLDQALGEALLLHQKWLSETKGTTENLRVKYKKEAEYITNIFKDRQQAYNQYWKSYSCGTLSVDGTFVACKDQLTYEGMTMPMNCDQQRQSTPSQVTCRRIKGVLKWDSRPRCKFVWGSYESWGSCSKTCGGGTKYKYRLCLGTNNVDDCKRDQGGENYMTTSCETQDCCSDQYGKFKCPSGKCITNKWICDGDDDCGDYEDERRFRCPNYIRSGDMIALKSRSRHYHGWLSCWCTINCDVDRCKLRDCPGTDMAGNDWDNCHGETFFLYLADYAKGVPVRSGDRIAIHYAQNRWLSCWGSGGVCPTRDCPGYNWNSDSKKCRGEMFWIYSPDRHGSCSTDTSRSCRGEPIQKNDIVFIQYSRMHGSVWWLSEDEGDIRTRTCPGRHIEKSDKERCYSEAWNIFSRY